MKSQIYICPTIDTSTMKKIVWQNKSNGQLCITVPKESGIKEGDVVEITNSPIKKIAYLGVVGDLFHYGHLNSIKFAKSVADYLICGVITDEGVEKYRMKPIANLQERKAIISSLNFVDKVIVQKNRDPTENLQKIHEEFPNAELILVHGSDIKNVHGKEFIKEINGNIVQHPYYERLSTTKIINYIIENQTKVKDIADFSQIIEGKQDIDSELIKGNKTIISTKAKTLMALKPLLKKSKIEEALVINVKEWFNKKEEILDKARDFFKGKNIVVRSSAMNEDTMTESNAGCFESILNVDSNDKKEIENAVKEVIKSYKGKNSESSFNQVLLQNQTKNISISGVLFTRTLEKSSPYYVINYDDSTGTSDSVTKGIENKSIKISRFSKEIPNKFVKLIDSVKEIESLLPSLALDIEFAINKNDEVIIFQVRPLTTALSENNDEEVKELKENLKIQFNSYSEPKKHLSGQNTIFADMPDWNPAEIIGDTPNYLDYSLYDYIITNTAWHEARTSQGYYNVNPAQLVVLFGNKPYIDVRHSFNSFIPNTLDHELREKLVNFYLDKLENNPELQDKVEFEILFTCFDFSFSDRAKELISNGFTEDEVNKLKTSLLNITNTNIINNTINKDFEALKELEKNRNNCLNKINSSSSVKELLNSAKYLLDDCKNLGTVQFSRLARLGFKAKIILKSLVTSNVITQEYFDNFMNSISTVATDINLDFKKVCNNIISKEDFIKKYYHLRPGTYDITSLRYDKNPELLKTDLNNVEIENTPEFILNNEDEINFSLKEHGLNFDTKTLFSFAKNATEAREFSKFEFSKNLSDAIELISLAGQKMGFTNEELAYLSVEDLFKVYNTQEEYANSWQKSIEKRIKDRELKDKLLMPPIIFSERDIDIVQSYTVRPNFITQKSIKNKVVDTGNKENIEGNIVMIENGDPGYDWIFTRNPSGLITKYGGVASHMSIRCAEFGIPAAIGCGELYDKIKNNETITLDCKNKKISKEFQ